MLKIGDFSKLAHVTVKALRLYGELGLLKPTWIDRFSGYRYYSLEQLPRLNRILALKDLGFSLDQIGALLDEDLPVEQLRGMLRVKQAEVEVRMRREQLRLAQVEARLQQIEQSGLLGDYAVAIKKVEPLNVISNRRKIASADLVLDVSRAMRDEMLARLSPAGLRSAGFWMVMNLAREWAERSQEVEVAVGVEIDRAVRRQSASVRVERLPAVPMMASVIHTGLHQGLPQAYTALYAWIEDNLCRPCGPVREVYLEDSQDSRAVVEVQMPVESMLVQSSREPVTGQQENKIMQPKIVTKPAFTLVGGLYVGKNENGEIGGLWDQIIPRFDEIEQVGPHISYGMCGELDETHNGAFEYIAGLEAREDGDVPDGMIARRLPEQRYAVFTHHGPLEGLHATYDQIYQVWLPASGLKRSHGPELEVYEEGKFDGGPNSEMEIWVPVL